ncbi:MAG: hypothetical protein R2689_08110 [Microthrixaceae bacterium]
MMWRHRTARPLGATNRGAAFASALAAIAIVGATGCAKSPMQAFEDLQVEETPVEVVASSLLRLDGRVALGPDLTRTLLKVQLVPEGYSWADADCAVDAVIGVMGAEAFAVVPAGKIRAITWDYPGSDEAALACRSSETEARRNHSVTKSDITIADPQPGPDPDPAAVRELQARGFSLGAERAGLTLEERECILKPVIGDWTDADYVLLAQRSKQIRQDDVVAAVDECLDDDRAAEAATTAVPSLLAANDWAQEESDRVDALKTAAGIDPDSGEPIVTDPAAASPDSEK